VEVAAGVLRPFIGSGRRGGGRPGSDGGGDALSSGGCWLRRGGEEEVTPIEGGERRRRPRGIWSRVEEVAGGTQWRAARPSEGRR
jgi:hypothetical protein